MPPPANPNALRLPEAPTLWQSLYHDIEQLPLPREVREHLINRAENVRLGIDPMRRHVIAEHAVEADKTPAQPVQPVQPTTDKHALAPNGVREED